MKKAIPSFENDYPGCQALVAFDNAKNHQKYVENALYVTENIKLGGKTTKVI
jgi:hypothetical protein